MKRGAQLVGGVLERTQAARTRLPATAARRTARANVMMSSLSYVASASPELSYLIVPLLCSWQRPSACGGYSSVVKGAIPYVVMTRHCYCEARAW